MSQEALDTTKKTVELTIHWNCPPGGTHTCVANISFYVKRLSPKGINDDPVDQAEHNEVAFTSSGATFTTTLSVDDCVSPLVAATISLLAPPDFTAPKPRTDCVLQVDARRFYLEKATLFRLSEYFRALFSGKYAEGSHEVVSIDDVDPQKFLRVLQVSEGSFHIMGDNVEGLLQVADRFLIDSVLEQCDWFILTSPVMTLGEKLLLADRYSRKECFETLLSFAWDSDQLKLTSEDYELTAELSHNGFQMLYGIYSETIPYF